MAITFASSWSNWSGSVRAHPQQILLPHSLPALMQIIVSAGQAGQHLRVVGSGHSFTPLAQSDDLLISLDALQGIEAIDAASQTVTVLAGTRLKALGDALLAEGLAQENLGDIDEQSIAGAISTGTHGTGIQFGNISTQVVGLTLITANAELLECSDELHPDIFKAAQISLGALGVIVKVRLRVVSARRLHFRSQREPLATCLTSLEEYKQQNSHFEFYWMPYTDWVQTKFLNATEEKAQTGNLWSRFNKVVLENGLYWLLSEICRFFPRLTPAISKLSAFGIATVNEIDYSHRLYATLRLVRFQEMEYNVPAEHFVEILTEIRACIAQQHFHVHFPIECRFVHADDIWLSPAYQRTSAYIAIHMYKGMPYQEYFAAIEKIFQRYQGRPHWGKMHTQTAQTLAALYPHWHDFLRIRAQLDPQGLFLNSYLRELFAIDDPVVSAPTNAASDSADSDHGIASGHA